MLNIISSLFKGSGIGSNLGSLFQQKVSEKLGSVQGNYGQLQGLQDLRSTTRMGDQTQISNELLQDHNMAMQSQQTTNEIRRVGQQSALSSLKLFAEAAAQSNVKTAEAIKELSR